MSVCPGCGRCATCGQPARARVYPYGIQPYINPVYPYGVVSSPSFWQGQDAFTTTGFIPTPFTPTNTPTPDEGGDDPAV